MNKIYKGICLSLGIALFISPLGAFALSKDETVYATLNSNGKTKKLIVTEHLINDEKAKTISDISNLKNITNVNGDETFSQVGNNLTWKANGNDIYYQGNSSDNLPIGIKVTYSLNGKTMSTTDMKNKKGHVVITINYSNKLAHYVNGSTIYTPFVVAAEMNLATKNNSNVTVTNGKVVSTGVNNIIVGISSPGLYDSLKISKLESLDSVVIEYDTTKFSKSDIYSVATSKILDDNDLTNINVDSIVNQVNTLQDAANKVVDGSKSLLDGVSALNNGANDLKNGSLDAYNGTIQIKAAVDGAINQAKANTSDALDQATIDSISTQAKATIDAKFTAQYKDQIGKQAAQTTMTSSEYQALEAKIADIDKQVKTNSAGQLDLASLYKLCKPTVTTGYENTCTNFASAIQGYETYTSMEQLMTGTAYNTAISVAYNSAVTTAQETATSVAKNVGNKVKATALTDTENQLAALSNNLGLLESGLKKLNDGTNSLNAGTTSLLDGTNTLYNGLNTFNESGIKKVSNLINGEIKGKVTILKDLSRLSSNYSSFDTINNNITGNTKFIMVTK